MIRFIIALADNKAKAKKEIKQDADQNITKHPAAFQIR